MKILLIFLLVLTGRNNIQSQTQYDTSLTKFVGTWEWTYLTDTVTIILRKEITALPSGLNNEVFVGWHKYVHNEQVIQSLLQYVGLSFDNSSVPLGNDLLVTLYGFSKSQNRIWFVGFWDLNTHKNCELFFELLPNSTTQAKWNLRGNTVLPYNLILTKL